MQEHSLSRRRVLGSLLLVAAGGVLPGCRALVSDGLDRETHARATRAVAAGARFLWASQSEDGLFRSRTYGLLRGGQSLTPFVLESLLRISARFDPPEVDRAKRVVVATTRLLDLRATSGALGFAGSASDYPCYSTGLLLSCLGLARLPEWAVLAAPSADWLLGQQLRSALGWKGHPAEGGWGMGTPRPLTPPDSGHVDLSMTRRVLEGLRAVGRPLGRSASEEARGFILRCQRSNGGFVYSPVDEALNKGVRSAVSPSSETSPGEVVPTSLGYGSATSDALLALAALGDPVDRLANRGLAWLRDNHRVDVNPGVERGPMAPFAAAMRGYYRAGSARCFTRWGGPPDWRAALVHAVADEQHADGAWRNESALQKEDDPLVATPLALSALVEAVGGGARVPGEVPPAARRRELQSLVTRVTA